MQTKSYLAIILMFLTVTVFADTAIQTDWSGESGIQGPVSSWGVNFWESGNIEWSDPGEFYISGPLFHDTFNRYCPDDWGAPDVGSTYYYLNPGSADFSITDDTGYLDDTSQHYEPWAFSDFSESTNSYTFSFSWKYDAGVHSGVKLFYNDTLVIGIRQDEYEDKLRFFDGSAWINIGEREPGVWKNYEVIVNGDSADVYVDGILVLQTVISSLHVNKIGFGANGLGSPSDSWFDDVHVYNPSSLTSSILNLNLPSGKYIDWGTIDYIGAEPSGTAILVRVRASSDFNNMGLWSSWLVSGESLENYCGEYDQYFQYQVLLTTNSSWNSPVFEQIEILYEFYPNTGVAEPHIELERIILAPHENPAFGHIVMELCLPETRQVRLDIYDILGRVVCRPIDGTINSGVYEIVLQDLMPGVYMVRLETNGTNLVRRVLLL